MPCEDKGLRLDFDSLPLIEAAVRITFATPLNLTFSLVNGLADSLREDFPELTEPDGFEQPPGINLALPGPPKILGAVLSGNPQGLRVVVHSHLLAVRWVQQTRRGAPPYPRYQVLEQTLWRVYGLLKNLQPQISPLVVNMVYVNTIAANGGNVLQEYFTEQVTVKAMEAGTPLEYVLSWREQDSLDLRVDLRSAQVKRGETIEPAYRLATAAGGFLRPGVEIRDVLSDIHNRLQVLFSKILSDKAKKEWGLHVGR